MVRKRGKTQADLINLRFNACAKRWSQFKKDGVKAKNFRFAPLPPRTLITRAPALMPATLAGLPSTRVAPAHACSGSRTRALFPSVMSRSACWIERSEFGCEFQLVFNHVVQPCTDLTKLRLRKFAQFGLRLFDFAHAQRLNGFFSTSSATRNAARRF